MSWANSIPAIKMRSRRAVAGLGVALLAAGGAWTALRTQPWFGPMVADGLRAVLGSERVTRLEELEASAEDRVQHATQPQTARGLRDSTPDEVLVGVSEARHSDLGGVQRPSNVEPLFPQVASTDDGVWQSVQVRAGDPSVLYRTILHPDPERKYAELFVFSLDLTHVQLHAVAGSIEPVSASKVAVERPGVVPTEDRSRLIAAFNGGFKAEHGHFGMMVGGTELLAPKPDSCTVAARADGSLRIEPWSALASEASGLAWWRQTPGCMISGGALASGLREKDSRDWGATLEGKTVIRRSALALSDDGTRLLFGISNYTTARAIALGMQRAGATTVAQLDVNFSFPRFVLYDDGQAGALRAIGAVKGFLSERDEYIGRASTRDFFYVTAR